MRKISTQSLADSSGEELLRSLQIVEKQCQSLSTLIKDLLNVSLASIGKLTLNKEKVDLSELTESLVKRFEEEIKLYDADVRTVIKEQKLIANLDPIRIEQAVSNLLINALKYSGGGKIFITVEKKHYGTDKGQG